MIIFVILSLWGFKVILYVNVLKINGEKLRISSTNNHQLSKRSCTRESLERKGHEGKKYTPTLQINYEKSAFGVGGSLQLGSVILEIFCFF